MFPLLVGITIHWKIQLKGRAALEYYRRMLSQWLATAKSRMVSQQKQCYPEEEHCTHYREEEQGIRTMKGKDR